MRIRFGVGISIVGIVLFAIHSFAFAQSINVSLPPTENIPPEIQVILKKDQKTWTTKEQNIITKFIVSTASSSSLSLAKNNNNRTSGTVNCFDYYHFGSVQVNLSSTLTQTVPGATLGFSGEIKNTNEYPIVDGQVYVKIFKQRTGEGFNPESGSALIDQFSLEDTFVLPAYGSKKAFFRWKVPENAEAGEYTVAFFFQTAKRYNLLGLSFTDDVTGNKTKFTVTSDDIFNLVAFNKNNISLNGTPYHSATFPPHFAKDEPVTASMELINPRNETAVIPINWKLYSWDGLRKESLKDTKTESVRLEPRETKIVSYTVSPIQATVSYLVAEADDAGSKSILNIRFVRDGINETRINFPGITEYPLQAGKEETLFSCVHSTNTPFVDDSSLTLTLMDEGNNVIHSYTYTGGITSSMMGVKDTFTPKKTYSNFSLKATLKNKGKIVEEVSQMYSCIDIDPTLCQKSLIPSLMLTGLGLVVAIILSIVLRRRLKDRIKV